MYIKQLSSFSWCYWPQLCPELPIFAPPIASLPLFIWIAIILVIAGSGVVIFLYHHRLKLLHKKAALEQQVRDLEMKALRAQMNPHFMFNALNSVRYFILKEDRQVASDYLTHFSKLLRNVLTASKQNLISLEGELRTLEIYLEFEKARFDDKFDYQIFIANDINTSRLKVQPLIIQPFAENAIWHGLLKKEGKGHLGVDIRKNSVNLLITITDNGVGRKATALQQPKAYKSSGMEITRQRLQLLKKYSNTDVGFNFEDLYQAGQPAGTRVTIKLPLS